MPGETTADTGLGKATGRAEERSEAPKAVVGAGAGEGVMDGLAAPPASLGDEEVLLSIEGLAAWLLSILHVGFEAVEAG